MNKVTGLVAVAVAAAGCGAGDDLGAPRLKSWSEQAVVRPLKLAFDLDNKPLALLYADWRQKITRLAPDGWRQIVGTDTFNVLDVGTDADGAVLLTVAETPGTRVMTLHQGDSIDQIGGRINTSLASEPFQSTTGTRYVATSDGGRRLPKGQTSWAVAPVIKQITRDAEGSIYGMTAAGLVHMNPSKADLLETVLPCAKFPVDCQTMTVGGIDGENNVYFTAPTHAHLWVLKPGATDLEVETIAGVDVLGSVRAAPGFVALEAIATDDDARHSFLYVRLTGEERFRMVDLAAHPTLDNPLLAVDRVGTMWVADGNWLGTIDLRD